MRAFEFAIICVFYEENILALICSAPEYAGYFVETNVRISYVQDFEIRFLTFDGLNKN